MADANGLGDAVRTVPIASGRAIIPAASEVTAASSIEPSLPHARVARLPARTPLIDIHESPEGLVLEADLPGASDRSLTIHLEHNLLHLRASVEPSVPSEARLIQQEYPLGDFERTFILSDDVDRGQITAELKNGVLRICLPRAERTRTRRIDVKVE